MLCRILSVVMCCAVTFYYGTSLFQALSYISCDTSIQVAVLFNTIFKEYYTRVWGSDSRQHVQIFFWGGCPASEAPFNKFFAYCQYEITLILSQRSGDLVFYQDISRYSSRLRVVFVILFATYKRYLITTEVAVVNRFVKVVYDDVL